MEKTSRKSSKNKSSNPYNKMRKREVVGSNGILNETLQKRCAIGETAEFRRHFSALARASDVDRREGRASLFTRTIQARNFVPGDSICDLVDDAYLTYHTYAKGSLARLLLGAHAVGFRFFSKSALASAFLSSEKIATIEKRLKESVDNNENLKLPLLSASSIYNALSTGIRGKGEKTEVDPLVVRFYTAFTGKPLSKDNSTPEKEFCTGLAVALVEHYETWSKMIESPVDSYALLEPLFSSAGFYSDLTSAISILDYDSKLSGDLSYRTIAFDKAFSPFDPQAKEDLLLIGLCARYAQEAVSTGANIGSHVKSSVTTTNANGLGWFFNKGMKLLPSDGIPNDEIKQFIGCDKYSDAFSALVSLMQDVKEPGLFGDVGFEDVRSSIQGDIDSFISNHIARLQSSLQVLTDIAESFDELVDTAKSKMHICSAVEGLQQFEHVVNGLDVLIKDGIEGANVLLGNTSEIITQSLVENSIAKYSACLDAISYLVGCIKSINGAIKRSEISMKQIEIPASWSGLISLPSLGLPVRNIADDIVKIRNDYRAIKGEYDHVISTLFAKYDCSFKKSLDVVSQKYKAASLETKHPLLKDPKAVAYRECLSRLTSAIFKGSDKLRRAGVDALYYDGNGVLEDKKEIRDQLYHRKYHVFISPYDTSRKPKKLVSIRNGSINLIMVIDGLLKSDITPNDRDSLEATKQSILLASLPNEIPSELIRTETVASFGDSRFRHLLNENSIERAPALMLINSAYNSKLSGLRYRMNKKEFKFTRTFSPYTDNRLIYVPNNRDWKVPVQMAEGRFAELLKSDAIVWAAEGVISVEETAYKLVKSSELKSVDVLAFLRELPHRFYFNTGLNIGDMTTGISINAGVAAIKNKLSGLIAISLPTDHKALIKAVDSLFNGGKVSPPSIQFERSYSVMDELVTENKTERRIIFQLPTTVESDAGSDKWDPKFILGIDPGSYGFGLSLIDLTGTVVDSGYVSIPSIRYFINKKTSDREVAKPRQQYRSISSNHLSQAADAAVGDICHIIDRIMKEHNAVPIFESLGGDGKDPSEAVWTKVLAYYTYGDNDAQNSARKSHWFGANQWDTEWMRLNALEKKPKPFIGFPGGRVSSFGNSQQCCKCGRNPIDTIRQEFKNDTEIVVSGSELALGNGTIYLENPNPETAKERKVKGLPPEWIPIGDKQYRGSTGLKDLVVTVLRSIRRQPIHKKKTQGTESVYHCAYKDCGSVMNAEANAGTNVGKKFIEQVTFK